LFLGPATAGVGCSQPAQGATVFAITGSATLAGRLNVASQGCTASADFTMLTFASRNGTTFTTFSLPPQYLAPAYTATSVVITTG
jgi:hypothetical protein